MPTAHGKSEGSGWKWKVEGTEEGSDNCDIGIEELGFWPFSSNAEDDSEAVLSLEKANKAPLRTADQASQANGMGFRKLLLA